MIDYTAKDIGTIGNFRFWCQKVLPAVYDDSLSYYELLCKVIDYLNEVIDKLNLHSEAIMELYRQLEELRKEFEEFKTGGLEEFYEDLLDKWIRDNMQGIIEQYIRMVFFGLTLDGYFVAYIPDRTGWDDITFDTVADYQNDDYGRLVLRYYVNGEPKAVRQ